MFRDYKTGPRPSTQPQTICSEITERTVQLMLTDNQDISTWQASQNSHELCPSLLEVHILSWNSIAGGCCALKAVVSFQRILTAHEQ
jgi:hypothetical protein